MVKLRPARATLGLPVPMAQAFVSKEVTSRIFFGCSSDRNQSSFMRLLTVPIFELQTLVSCHATDELYVVKPLTNQPAGCRDVAAGPLSAAGKSHRADELPPGARGGGSCMYGVERILD